uniref:Rho family GTPase 2 n=1 Tax=Crocodylus porosus TaxID=8502 RepID=A0A7M4EM34_CROPO
MFSMGNPVHSWAWCLVARFSGMVNHDDWGHFSIAAFFHLHSRWGHSLPPPAPLLRTYWIILCLGPPPRHGWPYHECELQTALLSGSLEQASLSTATAAVSTRNYVPTVFENYTASFEIEKQRIELNMWDTSGSAYYDNVRPLAYPDSDAVLICFDISRPETLDSVLKKWQGETQEFCPNAKIVLVGCKLDMRTDLNTLRELSKQRLIPVTHEQGSMLARQIGAVAYVECSSKVSENSVRDVFHVTTLASVNRMHKNLKRSNSKRGLKRVSQMPGRTDLLNDTEIRKDRAKSCSIM